MSSGRCTGPAELGTAQLPGAAVGVLGVAREVDARSALHILDEGLLESDRIRGGHQTVLRCARGQDGAHPEAEDDAQGCTDDAEQGHRNEHLHEGESPLSGAVFSLTGHV